MSSLKDSIKEQDLAFRLYLKEKAKLD